MVSFIFSVLYSVVLLLLAVPHVRASPTPASNFIPDFRSEILVPRQSGFLGFNLTSIPSQCQSDCADVSKIKDCGADGKCICSDGTSDNIAKCLNCFVAADNKTLGLPAAQQAMDTFTQQCGQAGFTVKAEKLNGTPNGALNVRPEVIGMIGVALSGLAILL